MKKKAINLMFYVESESLKVGMSYTFRIKDIYSLKESFLKSPKDSP